MALEKTLTNRASIGVEMEPYSSELLHFYLTQSNKNELGKLVSYLSDLYRTGEISEKAFERLVEYSYQSFVEAEVKSKLSSYLEQKLLQRLGGYLEQRLVQLYDRLASDESALKLLGVSTKDD